MPAVRLDQRGGDAFAWSERVSGSADCAEVTLLVNGRPVPEGTNVPVKDGRFSVVVPIGEGRNEIVARRADAGGSAGDSAPLVFTGRLKARPAAWIDVSVDGETVTLDGGDSEPAQPDGAEVVRYAWSPDPDHPSSLTTASGRPFGGEVNGQRLQLRAPGADGESEDGEPTHYFDWTHLPNLDYGNPEVRRMIVEAFSHWVRDLGIDGFRVDAAWGIQRRRPDFWPSLRRELKRIDPDILLLAEASATDPYFFSHGFDVAYDWTDELGQWAWTPVFDFPREIQRPLGAAITNDPKGYARDAIVMRFINNNDTEVRFVDRHGPELTRVAATLQFTVPGIPGMFAGDEIGASYRPYSNLTPIPWQDRHDLRPHYQRLIDLKHRVPALNTRDVDLVASTPGSSFAYLRPAPNGGEPVLVVLNFGGQASVELRRTPGLDAARDGRDTMRDLLTDRPVRLGVGPSTVTIPMAAESAYVLTPGAD